MPFHRILVGLCLLLFSTVALAESYQLRVMSYNINGLPWPLIKDKEKQFTEIARLINEQKKGNAAPHVLLIQEGFRGQSKKLIQDLNYPYVFQGPKDSDLNDTPSSGAIVGSGLWILSQYPIVKSDKLPFGEDRCAGYDCYANKGVAYVQIQVPNIGPVDIFSTHMNSKKSSGVSDEKVWIAQRKQIQVAHHFLGKNSNAKIPIIFSGDFNVKSNSPVYPDLVKALTLTNVGHFCESFSSICKIGEATPSVDLHVSPDQHFYRENNIFKLNPVYAAKTMRQKIGDKPLSDHLAYIVHYKFDRK